MVPFRLTIRRTSKLPVQWSVLVGPNSVGFSSDTSRPTTATFNQPGIYTVAMVALANGVAVGMDTVTVRVYSTNDWSAGTAANPIVECRQ